MTTWHCVYAALSHAILPVCLKYPVHTAQSSYSTGERQKFLNLLELSRSSKLFSGTKPEEGRRETIFGYWNVCASQTKAAVKFGGTSHKECRSDKTSMLVYFHTVWPHAVSECMYVLCLPCAYTCTFNEYNVFFASAERQNGGKRISAGSARNRCTFSVQESHDCRCNAHSFRGTVLCYWSSARQLCHGRSFAGMVCSCLHCIVHAQQ